MLDKNRKITYNLNNRRYAVMKKLGFGLMRLPQLEKDCQNVVDLAAASKMADEFIANGFTYFDTAAPYHSGQSETVFREAVAKRYPRDAYTITDKLSMFMIKDEKEIPGFFEGQLERLGVDYLDYYLLHGLGEVTYRQSERMHAFDFVKKLKAEGRVKHIGLSFHDKAALLEEILTKHPEMEYVQLQINYVDWEDDNIQARKCYEVATKFGKPVIVMEPVKGGSLATVPEQVEKMFKNYAPDMSAASWAVRFAASHENVMMVLSGMSNDEQLRDNMSFMKEFKPLSDVETGIVMTAADIIKNNITIPCTACRYCVDDCPKHIAIPDCFSIYNNMKRFEGKQTFVAATYYENLIQNNGRAGDCIKCGKCEKLCPQHLPIREYLKEVSAALD